MRKLSQLEIDKVTKIINNIVNEGEIEALCIYGSQIAGYSKPDSDYDVIIVLKDYAEKVKYKYVEDDIYISALLIDTNYLISDARKGSLGEFVVGRLLNPYLPLIGKELIESIEVDYKTRIITEILTEIVSTNGDFSRQLLIPLEFFLFEKLRKRSAIYPPTTYSYVKSYFGNQKEDNINQTLSGFRKAVSILEENNLVKVENDILQILTPQNKASYLKYLSIIFTDTTRGVKQYVIHGYAGRVGLKIFNKEARSKFNRMKEINHIPEKLAYPKKLWRIEEGILVSDSEDWRIKLKENLGLNEEAVIKAKNRDPIDIRRAIYDSARIYEINYKDKSTEFIVKKFNDLRAIKWHAINLWIRSFRKFRTDPTIRLSKEYRYIRELKEQGFNTPKILAVSPNDRILITEFIEGIPLDLIISDKLKNKNVNLKPIRDYGKTLKQIHDKGYSLGDTKPNNSISIRNQIYLIDLEQTEKGGNKTWDIVEFLFYVGKFTNNLDSVKEVIKEFIKGYSDDEEELELKKASNIKYWSPFSPFLSPSITKIIRNELNRN